MEEKQGALDSGLVTQIECNIGNFQVVVDSLCTRLCPKEICQSAMLFKANPKSNVGSQKRRDLLIPKIVLIFSVQDLKVFSVLRTLTLSLISTLVSPTLNLPRSTAVISVPSYSCQNLF